jgi:hypothetical protein
MAEILPIWIKYSLILFISQKGILFRSNNFYRQFIVVHGIQIFVAFVRVDIVCFTSINLQKKILKNPVFKPTFFFRCVLIYDKYELRQLI